MKLGTDDARQRFEASPIARLATVNTAGEPHLVPFTFALDGDVLYFAVDHKPKRSTNLRRLRNIRENEHVAALVDHYADDWTQLWWVRVDGRAQIIEDEARRKHPVQLLQDKYHQYREQPPEGPVVAVKVTHWSGWSFT